MAVIWNGGLEVESFRTKIKEKYSNYYEWSQQELGNSLLGMRAYLLNKVRDMSQEDRDYRLTSIGHVLGEESNWLTEQRKRKNLLITKIWFMSGYPLNCGGACHVKANRSQIVNRATYLSGLLFGQSKMWKNSYLNKYDLYLMIIQLEAEWKRGRMGWDNICCCNIQSGLRLMRCQGLNVTLDPGPDS